MFIRFQSSEREGKKEFLQLQEALEDYDDLRMLRAEKAQSAHEIARPLDVILAEMAAD